MIVTLEALKRWGLDPRSTRVVIQGMGNVGGWNPARAQVGRERGVIEDAQLFVAAETEWLVLAADVAGCGARPDVQPAAARMVSRISARHRRRIGQAYAWVFRPMGAGG